jgi:lysyl-tRNA synthetase class 2
LAKSVADVPFGKTYREATTYSLADIETRRQKRYLDWITNAKSQERFRTAAKVLSLIRRFLEADGFLEVSTPTLEPVYGGAEARPFTTDVWALGGQRMYLRVSPELYLKRYIVGGFPKVFTICQNFRNEGIDSTHNPEFTMMEWYEAYTDYEDQMRRFENLTCHLVESLHGKLLIDYKGREVDFRPPWPRLRIPKLIEECFGLPASQLDRATLEGMRGISLEPVGTGKSSSGRLCDEVRTASLGALIMQEVEDMLRRQDRLWNPCFLCDHPKEISPLTKVKRGAPGFV